MTNCRIPTSGATVRRSFPQVWKDPGSGSLLISPLSWWVLWIRLDDLPPGAVPEHAHVSARPVILVTLYQTHTSSRLEDDPHYFIHAHASLIQLPILQS